MAALLAQLGLFLLLASRFWQRGLEAALVMSADPPRIAREEMAAEEMAATVGEELPAAPAVEVFGGSVRTHAARPGAEAADRALGQSGGSVRAAAAPYACA